MRISVVAAVNNEEILTQNLADSPIFTEAVELSAMRGYNAAGCAYNVGLDAVDADIVVFAHQDVYLPLSWYRHLQRGLHAVGELDPDWAVIGVYGVSDSGEHIGHCWSSGLNRVLGAEFSVPHPIVSIDELVIILKKSSGIRFDEALPGFHLYGTDIVQTALAAGLGAYVIHAPVIHNSNRVRTLHGPYTEAYHYMRKKWKANLPIPNTVVTLTRYGYPLFINELKRTLRNVLGRGLATDKPPRVPGHVISENLYF